MARTARLGDAAARAPVADATDEWVGDYSDVVATAAAGVASPVADRSEDRQAVWDDMLQDLAEKEAAEARTDVDEQWSAYLRSLQVTKEIDAVMIGGVDGPAPCPLCKREMRMKEVACVFASADPKSRSEFVALLRKVQGGGLWQEEETATEPATVGQRVTRDCTRPCYRQHSPGLASLLRCRRR